MGYNTTVFPLLSDLVSEETPPGVNLSQVSLPGGPPPGGGGGPAPNLSLIMRAVYLLHTYYQPNMIAFGLLMNLTTFALLMGSKLSAFSSTRYLAACTFNDLIFLLILLLQWLTERGFPLYRLGALCHVTTFFLHSTSFLSMWYTVCYSVDRFLSTCLPGWEKQLCTPVKANVVIICIAILALVVYLNISLTFTVVRANNRYICIPVKSFQPALWILKQINIFINILVPYILIVIMWLTCAVRCYMDRRLVARRPVVTRNRVSLDQNSLGEGQNLTYLLYITIFLLFTSPIQIEQCRQTLTQIANPNTGISLSSRYMVLLLNYPHYTRSCLTFFICISAHRGFRSVLVMCLRNFMKKLRKMIQKGHVTKTPDGGICLEDFQEEEESRVALCGNSPSKRDCMEL